MNEVSGAWEFVKKNSAAFKPLFCHSPRQLSAEELSKIFKVSYSEIGTNARTLEDVTVYAWEMFVQSIEGINYSLISESTLVFTVKCTLKIQTLAVTRGISVSQTQFV